MHTSRRGLPRERDPDFGRAFCFLRLCYYLLMIEMKLRGHINKALVELGILGVPVVLERPADLGHGDFATNVAMAAAKKAGKNPRALAGEIVTKLELINDPDILAIEIAGPGFINFKLSKQYFATALAEALEAGEHFGANTILKGKKVIVEYTDPNPFKEFHIGHLMANTIGESISRIIEASGAETMRACYQGDVGLHVAKAVFSMKAYGGSGGDKDFLVFKTQPLIEQVKYLGRMYAFGAMSYDIKDHNQEKQPKDLVHEFNKKIYDRSDPEINELYDWGRKVSLDYFETIYKRLGTNHGDGKAFNFYFFESATGEFGKKVVLDHPEIFEQSEGAVVYNGDEAKGLHTRVFINKRSEERRVGRL